VQGGEIAAAERACSGEPRRFVSAEDVRDLVTDDERELCVVGCVTLQESGGQDDLPVTGGVRERAAVVGEVQGPLQRARLRKALPGLRDDAVEDAFRLERVPLQRMQATAQLALQLAFRRLADFLGRVRARGGEPPRGRRRRQGEERGEQASTSWRARTAAPTTTRTASPAASRSTRSSGASP
jgi:hypothetical protein